VHKINKSKAVHLDVLDALTTTRRYGHVETLHSPGVDDARMLASADSTIDNDEIRPIDSDNDV
jgi:hypothetical protein